MPSDSPPQPFQAIELPYEWADTTGLVRVEIRCNDDPAALGCADFARGFPYCRATVEPPARGYADALGWVQLVDHSGRDPGFAIDPFGPLGESNHPFAFFGFAPTMFDAPHSDEFEDWDFLAHSFLCGLGGELFEQERDVCAVIGFRWGFAKRGTQCEFLGPDPLAAADWERHRDYLSRAFAGWSFARGFRRHPLRP
jgi:hypothetical protein